MVNRVELSRRAIKQLQKVPRHIVDKLLGWVQLVETEGIDEARRIPGFHDEPLRGRHSGHRSIRLSRSYRAIYRLDKNGLVELVVVEEVTKHEY